MLTPSLDTDIRNLVSVGATAKRELFKKFALIQEGHPGSVLSIFDVVNVIYTGKYLNLNRKPKSDTFVMSKGHAASAQYPFLVRAGVIPQVEWDNWGTARDSCLRVFGNKNIPGIDITSGSLGHGLGISAGLALADKLDGLDTRHFTVISEGELYEGSTWEALLFIAHHALTSVHIIVDINRNIILGRPEELVALDPIDEKFASFGYETKRIDGHDYGEIVSGINFLCDEKSKTRVLLADTIKGKGVSFLEDTAESHYWNQFSKEQITSMLKDLSP